MKRSRPAATSAATATKTKEQLLRITGGQVGAGITCMSMRRRRRRPASAAALAVARDLH